MCERCGKKQDEFLVQTFRGEELISEQRLCEDCHQDDIDYEENIILAKQVKERLEFLEGKDIKFL